MGITLPGDSQQASAAGGWQQPLPQPALDSFRSELGHKEGQLQSELSTMREAHRQVCVGGGGGSVRHTVCGACVLRGAGAGEIVFLLGGGGCCEDGGMGITLPGESQQAAAAAGGQQQPLPQAAVDSFRSSGVRWGIRGGSCSRN